MESFGVSSSLFADSDDGAQVLFESREVLQKGMKLFFQDLQASWTYLPCGQRWHEIGDGGNMKVLYATKELVP